MVKWKWSILNLSFLIEGQEFKIVRVILMWNFWNFIYGKMNMFSHHHTFEHTFRRKPTRVGAGFGKKLFSPPGDMVHPSTIPIIKWYVW